MAITTDGNHAKRLALALDSGLKLVCDVPSTNPPIHLYLYKRWVVVVVVVVLPILQLNKVRQ